MILKLKRILILNSVAIALFFSACGGSSGGGGSSDSSSAILSSSQSSVSSSSLSSTSSTSSVAISSSSYSSLPSSSSLSSPSSSSSSTSSVPVEGLSCVTGTDFDGVEKLDANISAYMHSVGITRAGLAIMKEEKLLITRAYTADENASCTMPETRFRVASLSKPLTATAIMHLAQTGALSLDDKLVSLLPEVNASIAGMEQISVSDLLEHLGGWDAAATFDPMFYDNPIASALAISLPITQENILVFMNTKPLQHTPGTIYAYSNFGYMLLGMIIEKVSGESYETYVQNAVLTPLGISKMQIGASLKSEPDEARYLSDFVAPDVINGGSFDVPAPYGGFNLENMDANGGWIASVIDYMRFVWLFANPDSNPVLSPASIDTMFALPDNIAKGDYTLGDHYYAKGWDVRDYGAAGMTTWHFGSLEGTFTLVVRRNDGISWVFFSNKRGDTSYDIDALLHQSVDAITAWPTEDLFEQYYP